MQKEEFKRRVRAIRTKLAYLPVEERENKQHPLYQELALVKRIYAKTLLEESTREDKENDKHKRK